MGCLSAKKSHAIRERANSEYPFTIVMTGKSIVSRENFLQFAQCFYDKKSRFSVKLQDLLLNDSVLAWLPQLVSKKFLEEKFKFSWQIFASWCLVVKIAKISSTQKFPTLILFPINLSACMSMRLQHFIIPYIVRGTYLATKHFPFRSIHYFIVLFSKF